MSRPSASFLSRSRWIMVVHAFPEATTPLLLPNESDQGQSSCGWLVVHKLTCTSEFFSFFSRCITWLSIRRVAISLCHLLFQSPKASDALLFMTILSTDLRALKRRGYNGKDRPCIFDQPWFWLFLIVDRILRQQKAERQAAEDAARAKAVENNSLMSQSSQDTLVSNGHVIPPTPMTASPVAGSAVDRDEAPVSGPDLKGRSKPASNIVNSIQNFRRKFGSVIDSTHTGPSTLSQNDAIDSSSSSAIAHKPSSTVTPLTNICRYIVHSYFVYCSSILPSQLQILIWR